MTPLILAAALAGAVSSAPNMNGSVTMAVWGIEHEGTWAHFRFSGGAYAPTGTNALSTKATMLSHPYFKVSIQQAADLAAELRTWLEVPHNGTLCSIWDQENGLSVTGNNGTLWGPQFEPVVIFSLKYWLMAGERGEMHGEMYLPLPRPQVEALAAGLEAWTANPKPSDAALFSVLVQ